MKLLEKGPVTEMEEKKKYITPEMELVQFENADIITTSSNDSDNEISFDLFT